MTMEATHRDASCIFKEDTGNTDRELKIARKRMKEAKHG